VTQIHWVLRRREVWTLLSQAKLEWPSLETRGALAIWSESISTSS